MDLRRRRVGLLLLGAALVGPILGGPARAQEGPELPPVTIGPGSVVVRAGLPGSLTVVAAPRPYDGPVIRCVWHELVFGPDGSATSRPAHPVAGEAFVIWCLHPDDSVVAGYPRLVLYDPADPVPGEAISAADAARHALARIDVEAPRPRRSPPGRQIVGVPTWLAVAGRLDYGEVTAQAGPVWATVRLDLAEVAFDTGDGTRVVCSRETATELSGDCAHVYVEPSAPGGSAGEVGVSWTVRWRNDRDPTTWRVFDTLAVATPFTVEVRELQAAIR